MEQREGRGRSKPLRPRGGEIGVRACSGSPYLRRIREGGEKGEGGGRTGRRERREEREKVKEREGRRRRKEREGQRRKGDKTKPHLFQNKQHLV
jgi:hypothetical protein